MIDAMDRFYVFDGGPDIPVPSHRYHGKFYTTTKNPKTGVSRPDWEPIYFTGASPDECREKASAWRDAEEAKVAAHFDRINKLREARLAKKEAAE